MVAAGCPANPRLCPCSRPQQKGSRRKVNIARKNPKAGHRNKPESVSPLPVRSSGPNRLPGAGSSLSYTSPLLTAPTTHGPTGRLLPDSLSMLRPPSLTLTGWAPRANIAHGRAPRNASPRLGPGPSPCRGSGSGHHQGGDSL